MRAVRVHKYGGAEVLTNEDIPIPAPKVGGARVKIEAIGLNFIDIYQRTGLYPMQMPFTLGMEGAGVVDAIGDGVTEVKGRRSRRLRDDSWFLRGIRDRSGGEARAAASDCRREVGGSAYAARHDSALSHPQHLPIAKRDTALIHAAASGVGLLLIQIAKPLGARVIGTVGTEAKAQLAKQAGADEIILYTQTDFLTEVKNLTDGKGVNVVYDSVGATTFDKSLDCLRPRGYLVLFGQSSGPVAPVDPGKLAAKGSLFLTRPSLAHYMLDRAELLRRANDLFHWTASGSLKLRIEKTYPLSDAAEAQRELEGRRTAGKVILLT